MNIKKLLANATDKLMQYGVDSPNLEARILMQHAIGKSLEYLLVSYAEYLTEQEIIIFENFIDRRNSLEPIAYIIGSKEFYGYDFIVNNKVLVPRKDTEIIVNAVLEVATNSNLKILELGTGSGCIAISLLLEIPTSYITATDICNDALNIAKQNAIKHQVSDRLKVINSDWFKNVESQEFDIIVSNPPYISCSDVIYMSEETIKYEPHLALFAENNGLESYYLIAQRAKFFLKPSGKLLLEIGFNQLESVTKIFHDYGYKINKIYKDLAGHDRVMLIDCEQKI